MVFIQNAVFPVVGVVTDSLTDSLTDSGIFANNTEYVTHYKQAP